MKSDASASPDAAIKLAYDLGRVLRSHRSVLRSDRPVESHFNELAEVMVETHFGKHRLAPYLRSGFRAGYFRMLVPSVGDVVRGIASPPD